MAETIGGGGTEGGQISMAPVFGRRRSDLSDVKGVGDTRLIKFSGKQGFFIPLTDKDFPEESEDNLEKLLLAMQEQVKQLQLENLKLKQRLEEEIKKKHRTPDDFATAVSHSIDSLQTRLNDMKNPVSRFAIKEFNVDMTVFAEVTPLGTIDYRFIAPEDDVDPQRLTRINMSVVPLPKETDAGSYTSPAFTPMLDIEEIQGVGEVYQKRMNDGGIYTLNDLLTAGTRVRSKVELSKMLDVDHSRLGEWLSHAELMTIKDIDGRSAEVLADIGIVSLAQLAAQEPDVLTEKYNQRVEEMGHATVKMQSTEMLETWITSARTYVGAKR